MRRADYLFSIFALAVVIFFIVLSLRSGKHPAPMPVDADHQLSSKRAACLVCHSPEVSTLAKPISKNHPLKWKDQEYKCTNCHNTFR